MNTAPVAPAATEYLYRKAAAAGVPLSGTFELTPCCNMACKMCYVRMTKAQQEAVAAPVEENTSVKEAVQTAPIATEEIEVEVEQVEVELSEEDDKEEA